MAAILIQTLLAHRYVRGDRSISGTLDRKRLDLRIPEVSLLFIGPSPWVVLAIMVMLWLKMAQNARRKRLYPSSLSC